MSNECKSKTADQPLAMLQAKAALTDAFATEMRLYRGFVSQFGDYDTCRLFAPLVAYDALFGDVSDE